MDIVFLHWALTCIEFSNNFEDSGVFCRLLSLKSFQLKAFHKSHLLKLRVAPSETAMTDVLREVYFLVYLWFSV